MHSEKSVTRRWRKGVARRPALGAVVALTVLLLAGCYPAAYRTDAAYEPPPPSESPREILSQLYFYPQNNQTAEQQSRDHYECYNWAIGQTGFDPGRSEIPKNQRVRVVPMPPPGHDTAALAIAGAVLGALIGGPRHAVEGAMIGATGGVVAGAASDTARMESARQQEEAYAASSRARDAQLEAKARNFRRAMSACMEGRGYSVR